MAQPASPRISVVIPVYNGTNYLREAIESVFAQTYTDYEVIIVDDGSTDQTWSLIQSYGSRVRGIHKENGGISSALNCGIQQARGEYIAWLSHDDLFMPHKLERQIAMLTESPELGGCYSDYFEIDAQGKVVQEKRMPYYPPERVIRHLLQYMFINGCTVLMRQSCFEREGLFDENLRYAQDANMWFRLLRRFAFGHIPEFLVKYRIHPGQGSHKLKGRRADFHEFLRRCVEDYPLTDIFPELIGRETDNRTLARAHNCLGDSMRVCNHDYVLARAQYTQSLRYWRDIRNPALRNGFLNLVLTRGYIWARRLAADLVRSWKMGWCGQPVYWNIDCISASNAIQCPQL